MLSDPEPLNPLFRLFTAVILGGLGFATVYLAVWVLSDLPGLKFPSELAFGLAVTLGTVCLLVGYRFTDQTLDALGRAWSLLWDLSTNILSIIRAIAGR